MKLLQLIDKDALVAEIEERSASLISLSESCPANTAGRAGFYAQAQTLEGIKNFINNLDVVKEVDLEKEFYDFLDTCTGKDNGHLSEHELFRIAKYFYELGVKTKEE